MRLFGIALVLSFVSSSALFADVKLPKLFSDHMVLQRDLALPVWGWAEAGEKVVVKLGDETVETQANDQGKWKVVLKARPANSAPSELIVEGKNKLVVSDILIGEVWIGSGQSNMEWSVAASADPEKEIAAADHPRIRLFTVPRKEAGDTPQEDIDSEWKVCTPENIKTFSAVAYYFGRELQKDLDVPIGLIHTSWGGTPAEYWTPPKKFQDDPKLTETSEHPHSQSVMRRKSTLYNGMIHPLVPFAIRGAIWYQGESNVPMAKQYRALFGAMVTGWRESWGQGDFPFLYVQIAPWNYGRIETWPRVGVPLVREAQLQSLSLANTAMVVTMDIGDVNDIHPKNKQEVGRRLALGAMAKAYGKTDVIYSGPLYKSSVIEGNKIIVSFEHVGGGLTTNNKPLDQFQIAGKDGTFVPAKAEIVGETVHVSAEGITEPVAVRYAWQDDALPNLANTNGLPASPFRTDTW